MISDAIARDLKTALLAGETERVSVLRSLKSAMTYAQVAAGADKSAGLSDEQLIDIFAKEAKKRQESADAYHQAGNVDRASAELREKAIIEAYLPAMAGEAELRRLITAVLAEMPAGQPRTMGPVIAGVKQRTTARIDGRQLAALVKETLDAAA